MLNPGQTITVRLLRDDASLQIEHIGGALDESLAASARQTTAECPGYRWLGALPHEETRDTIAAAHALVHTSRIEGGANVVIEAVSSGVGEAVLQFDTGRMKTLGAVPPSRVERIIAEFQLGDPTSRRDAFRPWKRRTRSHRTLPAPRTI